MSRAKAGDTVKVQYIGSFADGTVFDKSGDSDFLEFTLGDNAVISGFDTAVLGMDINETKTVTILSKDAYGEYREENIGTIDRKQVPESMRIESNQVFEIQDENGNILEVRVVDYNDEEITIDANHPMAGKDLTFEITLKEIL